MVADPQIHEKNETTLVLAPLGLVNGWKTRAEKNIIFHPSSQAPGPGPGPAPPGTQAQGLRRRMENLDKRVENIVKNAGKIAFLGPLGTLTVAQQTPAEDRPTSFCQSRNNENENNSTHTHPNPAFLTGNLMPRPGEASGDWYWVQKILKNMQNVFFGVVFWDVCCATDSCRRPPH